MALLWAFEVWIRYGLSGAHLQFISNLSLCCQSTMQHICIAGGRVSSRTNPSLWYACERQYLETELCTPSLLLSEKVSSPKTLCCPQTHLSVKGAFKWRKFSLISAHRYYTETPHEFNVLTSFLKRIWVQLSESFSELKIGWFLWHLDQKIILTLTVNFYCTRIGGQFDTCITSVFNVTHGPIQLAKSATVCFTSNLAGIFIGSFSSCSPRVNNLHISWKIPSPRIFFPF